MTRHLLLICAVLVAIWTATSLAGGRKVLVLPLDGDADPGLRKQLTASLQKIARSDGDVALGSTTFGETAAAVGCDPTTPACGDTVLATLGVDVVIFGTASTVNGQTSVTVTRLAKKEPRRDQAFAVAATDPPDRAETAMKPLFGIAPIGPAGSSAGSDLGAGSGSDLALGSATGPTERGSFFDTRDRKVGFGLCAGGALALAIGFALWASESGLQTRIDMAPNQTAAQITALRDLEDQASTKAWEGNILVGLGAIAGGVGAYFLYRDHGARATATVVPATQGAGATVVLRGRW